MHHDRRSDMLERLMRPRLIDSHAVLTADSREEISQPLAEEKTGGQETPNRDPSIRIAPETLLPVADLGDGGAGERCIGGSSAESDVARSRELDVALQSTGLEAAIGVNNRADRTSAEPDRPTVPQAGTTGPGECNADVSVSALPAEDRADTRNDTTLLMRLAERIRTIRAPDGRYYAAVSVGEGIEYYQLGSDEFRRLLLRHYHEATGRLPRQAVVADVVAALRSRAEIKTDQERVFLRVARDQSEMGFLLDLGDSGRRAIRVSAQGWEFVDHPGVPFWRPAGQRALPVPVRGAPIDLLRKYVNVDNRQWLLLIGWLTAALQPVGPYPILVLTGEQGSAKTTLAHVCRRLIDPHATPLRSLPKSERDLMVSAHNNWLVAYDNISALAPWQSDAVCRLSTGGGFAARGLFTDDREIALYAQRPIILNGIDEFVSRGDLMDRSIFLSLQRILPEKRRGDRDFWAEFDRDHPAIFGALLDAAAGGVRLWPEVTLTKMSRMADLERWGEAVLRGLGFTPCTFLAVYRSNRGNACADALAESPLTAAIIAMIAERPMGLRGAPSLLYTFLCCYRPRVDYARVGWPKTPSALSRALLRMAPQLREIGILVTFRRGTEGRIIEVGKVPAVTQNTPA